MPLRRSNNTINDVATELKDNNDDANESGFEHYTEYNETDYVDSENENNYVDSDDENNYVDSDNESDDSDNENNYIESDDDESDDENDYVDSDNENNDVVSDNEVEHKNFEGSENILENNTLPNSPFDGEFGPYFSSSTSASIFAWITKHMITTNAYEDLVKILNHPNFDVKEVPTNIRYFKKNSRARLPLLTVKKYTIPISNMKTQSTSQPFREAYAISLFDIIKKTLSNPLLISKMYNGPGIEVENKSEFWHGEHNIMINSVEYFTGDFVHIMASNQLNCMRITSIILHNSRLKLKLQRFLTFDELPAQYQTADRYSNSSNKRWLLEDKPIIVEPEVIVGKTSVWLQDQEEPNYYTYIVAEILYNYQNKWKIRNICYRFKHPSEYCPFPQNPHNLPMWKIFIDLYYDDFGTFRNVYYSLGGVYIQIGNMPFSMRKLLKNHFIIGFVPFGGNFKEFISPFLQELKELEKGKVFNIQGKNILVIAGLGIVTADLPQGNDLVGVMRHNAKRGCRSCKIENHNSLKSFDDISKELRYHHLMDDEFDLILNSDSLTIQRNLCSKFGLKNQKPILDNLIRDQLLQSPQDIYHAIAGKILKLMDCTFNMFNSNGNNEFIKNWKLFEMPIQWHKLPNPITHRQSFMMSDRLRLAMIFPQDFTNLPNLHINGHLQHHAKTFATLVNSAVGVKEMVHKIFKNTVSHTNGKMIEKNLIKRYNTLQALRNIIDGTLDSHYNNFLGNGYFQDNIFRLLLSSWFATSATISNTEKIAINEAVESPDDSIYEIRLQAKWKQYKILQNNFETNISINGNIYYGLKTAYKEYFNFTEYLHNTKIIYFNYISYKVLNQDGESSIIQISVGNVVELEEELEGNSYAIVQAIFLHTYNNAKTYPFYFLKWFEKIEGRNGIDSLMMCQKYKICTERKKWHNVFPISFVTSMPKVHFVHQCVNDCSISSWLMWIAAFQGI
ncbi:hypothetical protein GLOIN_2v1790940 [Rhizophagus irregularis DAOM 181602=DAOM 197198]|nr:hypothetical protein GLOIN_2v1790940 [Rhizophagus irregularis DAOM 181602=DAOM 197198]